MRRVSLLLVLLAGLVPALPGLAEPLRHFEIAGRHLALPVPEGLCGLDRAVPAEAEALADLEAKAGQQAILIAAFTCGAELTDAAIAAGRTAQLVWAAPLGADGTVLPLPVPRAELLAAIARSLAEATPGGVQEQHAEEGGRRMSTRTTPGVADENAVHWHSRYEESGPAGGFALCAATGMTLLREIRLMLVVQGACDDPAREATAALARRLAAAAVAANP
jgi:hypothetical protein